MKNYCAGKGYLPFWEDEFVTVPVADFARSCGCVE